MEENKKLIKGRWFKLKINPFKERISEGAKMSGNYAIFIHNRLQYLGESSNLAKRINRHLRNMVTYLPNKNKIVAIKIRAEKHNERRGIEKKLISRLKPNGNIPYDATYFLDWGYKYEIDKFEDIIITNKRFIKRRKLIRTQLADQNNLDPREQEILKKRFGLYGDERKYTLQEIADQLHITRERVRQIIADSIYKLKPRKEPDYKEIDIDKEDHIRFSGLSKRPITCLERHGIKTIKDLKNYADNNDLTRLYLIKNFGQKCMWEVRGFLEKINDD